MPISSCFWVWIFKECLCCSFFSSFSFMSKILFEFSRNANVLMFLDFLIFKGCPCPSSFLFCFIYPKKRILLSFQGMPVSFCSTSSSSSNGCSSLLQHLKRAAWKNQLWPNMKIFKMVHRKIIEDYLHLRVLLHSHLLPSLLSTHLRFELLTAGWIWKG